MKKGTCIILLILVMVAGLKLHSDYKLHKQRQALHAYLEHEKAVGIRLAHSLWVDFEGFSTKCYKDNKGRIAVGHGFTTKKPKNCVIDETRSYMRIWDEILERSVFIDRHVKVHVNSNRRASLITFIANIGKQAFLDSEVLVAINNNDWEQARTEMLEWGVKNPKYKKGVAKRRQIEADLLL